MPPGTSAILALSRCTLAFVWIYQGVVPKLLGPDAVELQMNLALGITAEQAVLVSRVAGVAEIGVGLAVLLAGARPWPYWLTLVLMAGLTGYVVIVAPQLFGGAFNPAITNVTMAALAVIGVLASGSASPRRY